MLWGMYNVFLLSPMGGRSITDWLIGAHAHNGVLAILAIVLGFAVDHYDLTGSKRRIVTWFYIVGQWLLPATIIVALGGGMPALESLAYLWGILLFVAMAIMAWTAFTEEASAGVV